MPGRPKGISVDQIGLQKSADPTKSIRKIPKFFDVPAELELETTPETAPSCNVPGHKERMALYTDRAARGFDVFTGVAVVRLKQAAHEDCKSHSKPNLPSAMLLQGLTWEDMPVCCCSICGSKLLGKAWEHWRVLRGMKQAKWRKKFPPPIGRYLEGRPLCGICGAMTDGEIRKHWWQKNGRT